MLGADGLAVPFGTSMTRCEQVRCPVKGVIRPGPVSQKMHRSATPGATAPGQPRPVRARDAVSICLRMNTCPGSDPLLAAQTNLMGNRPRGDLHGQCAKLKGIASQFQHAPGHQAHKVRLAGEQQDLQNFRHLEREVQLQPHPFLKTGHGTVAIDAGAQSHEVQRFQVLLMSNLQGRRVVAARDGNHCVLEEREFMELTACRHQPIDCSIETTISQGLLEVDRPGSGAE